MCIRDSSNTGGCLACIYAQEVFSFGNPSGLLYLRGIKLLGTFHLKMADL